MIDFGVRVIGVIEMRVIGERCEWIGSDEGEFIMKDVKGVEIREGKEDWGIKRKEKNSEE